MIREVGDRQIGVRFPPGTQTRLPFTIFTSALQPIQRPIKLLISYGVKVWPGVKVSTQIEVNNVWNYLSTPPYAFLTWRLNKCKNKF